MKAVVVVLSSILLTACTSTPSAPSGPVDARVVLAPGASADVTQAGIQIRFQSVLNDSRCPGDATCIQAGDAVIRIDVTRNGQSQTTFDLRVNNKQPAQYSGLTVTLEELSPYPFASRPTAPGDYRATIRVTR